MGFEIVWKDTEILLPGLFRRSTKVFECLNNKLGSFGFDRVLGDFEPVRSGFVRIFFESTVFRNSVVREHFQFGTALHFTQHRSI